MIPPRVLGSLLIALVVIGVVTPAGARVAHLRCRDGVLVRRLCAEGCPQPVCDRDARCDGVCTFVLHVCREVACLDQTFVVPVGERQVVLLAGEGPEANRAVLVCRRHPPRLPCPQPGGPCTADADCPRLLGDPCVSCRAGICLADPRCV